MGRGIRFTTEFKREAVRLALSSGRPRAEIAEDRNVRASKRPSEIVCLGDNVARAAHRAVETNRRSIEWADRTRIASSISGRILLRLALI